MTSVLKKEDENDAEVRRIDQDKINQFARLNARLYELREERADLKNTLERLDDASTELMMGTGDTVMLAMGEAFFETPEEEATNYCEKQVETMNQLIEELNEEETDILQKQKILKDDLYARFGKSINLEAD